MKRLGLFLLLISAALVSLGSTPYDSPWRHYETFWRTADSTLIGPSGTDTIQSFPTGTTDTGTSWTYVSASGQWYYSKSAGQAGDWVVDIYETSGPDTLIVERYVIPGPVPGDSTVTGTAIQNDAIDSQHYTDASIDTDHLSNGAITAAKIDSTDTTFVFHEATFRRNNSGPIIHIEETTGEVEQAVLLDRDLDSPPGDSYTALLVNLGGAVDTVGTSDVLTGIEINAPMQDTDSDVYGLEITMHANETAIKVNQGLVSIDDDLTMSGAGDVLTVAGDVSFANDVIDAAEIDLGDAFSFAGNNTHAGTETFNGDVTINDVLYYSTDVARKFVWSGNVTSNVLYFPGAEYGDICVAHAIDVDDQIPAIRACECKTDSTTVYISVGTGADGDSLAVLLYKTP